MSFLCDIGTSLRSFLTQLVGVLSFDLLFSISLAIEVFFILLFLIKTLFSYEMRLRRGIDRANNWLFANKKIDQTNIKEFNNVIKKGPRRLVYFWQQYILYREEEPSKYMSADNLIEKPLKTSSFASNIKNLSIFTCVWALITFLISLTEASTGSSLRTDELIKALIIPILVVLIGFIAIIILKARKTSNLDEIYHIYHIFARFVDNACMDLPPYVDYDLLFSAKEIEHGNPQLREYYEARARKAKEEFEKAKQSDVEYVEYNFKDAGVDGSLVLERAMKESETYMNKKANTLAKIAHVEAQQEALKRNYENVQKDLQKKIQASKENIQKLIQQQEATTNRMEVGFLRKQQEQEISKQESLQNEYDQEETRFAVSNEELNKEIRQLNTELDEVREEVQRAMVAEYQTFYEKILKGAYQLAEQRVDEEKKKLAQQRDKADGELTIAQTQLKRLVDENQTLRARLGENVEEQPAQQGQYDENGNYVYPDGSYHDPNGLFHDIDGKIYDRNGTLIVDPNDNVQPEEEAKAEEAVEEIAQPNDVDQNVNDKMVVEDVSAQELGLEPESTSYALVTTQPNEIVAQPQEVEVRVETEAPKRKRGRPRKPVDENAQPKPARKRGRPRKEESAQQRVLILSEKDGLPKTKTAQGEQKKAKTTVAKTTTKTKTPAKTAAKKASPAKKTTTKKVSASTKTAAKKTTQKPRQKAQPKAEAKRDDLDIVSLAKINRLITEEEQRLSKMKAIVNNEISDALNSNEEKQLQTQREEIMKSVEELRQKAAIAKAEGKNEQELALINSRLEALINEMTDINNK